MLKQTKPKALYFAIILLGLFLSGLTSQFLHQFNNKARVAIGCETVDHHFHQDPDAHHCDLCDFKIDSYNEIELILVDLSFRTYQPLTYPRQPVVNKIRPFSNRAPPVS